MILGHGDVVTGSSVVHLCSHIQTSPCSEWTTDTHTQSLESPGWAVKEALLFGHLSLQPISQVVFQRVCGVAPHWLTSGVTVLGKERLREEGRSASTCPHIPSGYRLQPLFHLCLRDLPNDVFIYSTTSPDANTRWTHTVCRTRNTSNQQGRYRAK